MRTLIRSGMVVTAGDTSGRRARRTRAATRSWPQARRRSRRGDRFHWALPDRDVQSTQRAGVVNGCCPEETLPGPGWSRRAVAPHLWRWLLGSAFLAAVVIGSGIAIFHGVTIDAVSDLDLSYTSPLGSP